MSYELDILNFYFIVDLAQKYSDTIQHEARVKGHSHLLNQTRKVMVALTNYTVFLKSTLPREKSDELKEMVDKSSDSLDTMTLFEHLMALDDEQRSRFKEVIDAIKRNEPITINIGDR